MSGATYYIDYSAGSDAANGTTTGTPWKHCPGDAASTGTASGTSLAAGDTINFKGGVAYMVTGSSLAGIGLSFSGSDASPIVYDGNSSGGFGSGKAIITDSNAIPGHSAFVTPTLRSNIIIRNFQIMKLGGSNAVPFDGGSAVSPNTGVGVYMTGGARNTTIQDCDFFEIGFWFNVKPMGPGSIDGAGVYIVNWNNVTVTNCTFSKMMIAIEIQAGGIVTNATVANCYFRSNLVWCIDDSMGGVGATKHAVNVHHNTFAEYYQYDDTQWSGYDGWPHTDGIFQRTDFSGCVYGTNNNYHHNVFYSSVAAGGTASIYNTEGPNANIYNNVFIYQGKSRPLSVAGGPLSGASPHRLLFLNNTILTDFTPCDWGNSTTPVASGVGSYFHIKNNIFYDIRTGSGANFLWYSVSADPGTNILFNFNIYKTFNIGGTFFNTTKTGGEVGLTGLRAVGWETNGFVADPLFITLVANSALPLSQNLGLQSGSPAIAAGTNLTSLASVLIDLDKDYNGTTRPASGNWAIGAYEFVQQGPPIYYPASPRNRGF